MNKQVIAVVMASVLVVGCQSNPPVIAPAEEVQQVSSGAPKWVSVPPLEGQYLYGVGSAEVYGDSVRAAQKADDVARGDLIKQLKVSVSQSLTATTATHNNEVFSKTEIIVNSKVPETEMVGIERADTYVDEANKVVYAMVRLDRAKAIAATKAQLRRQELSLRKFETYQNTGEVMKDLRALMPALTEIRKYELDADKLNLLAANNKQHLAGLYMPTELKLRIFELISSMQVRLEPTNKAAHKLETLMARQLTQLDVKVVNSPEAELIIRYSLDTLEKENQQTQFVLMSADVTVVDSTGRVVTAGVISAKGGAYDRDVAHKRALAKVSDKIETEVVKGLLDAI